MDISRKSGWIAARFLIVIPMLVTSCAQDSDQSVSAIRSETQDVPRQTQTVPTDSFSKVREQMVESQLVKRDIVNQRVLDVMKRVPRHQFVPASMRSRAYDDSPLPIGKGQTISQPYIVALMTQLVDPRPHQKALDIGTGSGYQAAVLAELAKDVYSIEIVESLAVEARDRLKTMGYKNVNVRHGDGYRGWKSQAPFDVIIVAAAPDHIPPALVEQLAPGGKMVIPIGKDWQTLVVIEKKPDGTVEKRDVIPVAFVPMTGEARK